MRKTLVAAATIAVTCGLLAVAFQGLEAGEKTQRPAPEHGSAYDILDDALRAMAMTRNDLSFRTDYAETVDSFRLTVVDSLMLRPLDTEPYVLELAKELSEAATLDALVASAARAVDLTTRPAVKGVPFDDPMDVLLSGIREASALVDSAFAGLSQEERAFLAEHAMVLLEEEEFDPDKPIDVRDRETALEEELGDRLLAVAPRVDYEALAEAGASLARAIEEALPLLRSWDARRLLAEPPPDYDGVASGDVLLVLESDMGALVVGGPGPTLYEGECVVSVDLGGDDLYTGIATRCGPTRRASITIDMGGDDRYLTGDCSAGAGFMGAGILVDIDGDDVYAAGSFSQGSGLFGDGVLDDRSGDDTYLGDTCTQGSGAFGIGMLRDSSGNDSYEAALFSQAFGFTGGLGAVLDVSGNDTYFAGGRYTDEIRYFDHYLSLSQGFGYGWRPDASGGVAILADGSGNDVYVSDIFGQGSSYWFAVGGLVDSRGNDQYVSYQYAQGAGTHLTVAALVDLEGDDNYVSKGVSQGCGHDLAIGILHDLAGDDNYTCHDLSQGAGNANGIGMIADDAGDDAYSVRNPANTNGYGNYRRDYGSVGIQLDGSGADSYSGRGADGEWWAGSDHGIGVDRNENEEEVSSE